MRHFRYTIFFGLVILMVLSGDLLGQCQGKTGLIISSVSQNSHCRDFYVTEDVGRLLEASARRSAKNEIITESSTMSGNLPSYMFPNISIRKTFPADHQEVDLSDKTFRSPIFQDNFSEGKLSDVWKINKGKWYVADLDEKGIKPPPNNNKFALASVGDAEIMTTIQAENIDSARPLSLSFTYWVHSEGSKGLVGVDLLDKSGKLLKSISFEELPENGNWRVFNQPIKAVSGTSQIRLRLGERSAGGPNTVYFKNVCIGC